MVGFVIFIHSVVCLLLCLIILMQSGRGGGLTEQFSSAESLFGATTNVFLVKTTTVLASIFLVTCLSLAFFSAKQDKSLMSGRINVPVHQSGSAGVDFPQAAVPSVESVTNAAVDTSKETQKAVTETVNENAQPAAAAIANSVEPAPAR